MILIYLIIIANVVISWKGFNEYYFLQKHLFRIDPILVRKEYGRMISSGFLHVDYMHLAFNMFALYTFSEGLVGKFNTFEFAMLYAGSLLAGNLLALYIHRNHGNYSAVGASGAVSGVVYASIALYPHGGIGLIFIPGLSIPSWIFGILYTLYTIFGIKSQRGNIGHEAHLGGALAGLAMTLLYFVGRHNFNYWIIAAMAVPSLAFLYLIVYHPEWMMTGKIDWSKNPISTFFRERKEKRQTFHYHKKEHPGKAEPEKTRTAELNDLLDKVNRVGYDNLSAAEKKRLDQLSR